MNQYSPSETLTAGSLPRGRSRFWTWLRRLLFWGAAGLVLLAVAGYFWQRGHERETARKYPMPGQLIDVGGHRLHYQRQGTGTPVVVMDAGLSGASYNWPPISTSIAQFTEVFIYDRAGYGWSDQGPRPRSTQQVVSELRTLLQKAGAKPPYVMLGYSWGGANVRLYASLYPDEVAGLILVDAVNFDTTKTNAPFGQISLAHRLLAAGTPFGTARLALPIVLQMQPGKPNYEIQLDMLSRPLAVQTIMDELSGQTNWISVRAAMKHLGDLPVTVISRRVDENDNRPGQQWWQRGQKALLSISRNTKSIIASSESHGFPMDEPEIVVNGVREMVDQLRRNKLP